MFHDRFSNAAASVTSPATDCFAIEPSDDTDIREATKALYIGEGGDLTLRPVGGAEDVTFFNLASGSILDVRTRAVRATGTTAAKLIGLI